MLCYHQKQQLSLRSWDDPRYHIMQETCKCKKQALVTSRMSVLSALKQREMQFSLSSERQLLPRYFLQQGNHQDQKCFNLKANISTWWKRERGGEPRQLLILQDKIHLPLGNSPCTLSRNRLPPSSAQLRENSLKIPQGTSFPWWGPRYLGGLLVAIQLIPVFYIYSHLLPRQSDPNTTQRRRWRDLTFKFTI